MPRKLVMRDVGLAVGFAAAAVDLRLDLPHFLVGDDEEIAGAAGGIEDADAGDALAQVQQLAATFVLPASSSLARRSSRKSGLSTLRMFGTLV